ncbi:hypothetical protein HLB42_21800 (plasmid) [Deinococcus sp. D7000]|nr:hypothetical protein HLB42_21800 [Deinococcus sp. D7000]
MTIAKFGMSEDFSALELDDAIAHYVALLGITQTHPHGTLFHDGMPTPELRRREGASEGLGLYLGYVMLDVMMSGCHDPNQMLQAVADRLAVVIQAACLQKPPAGPVTPAQPISA